MNPNKLRRLFPNAPESFIKRNSDKVINTGMPCQSEPMDRKEVCETYGSEEMGKTHSLRSCRIEFFAQHGHKLDRDNKDYVQKVILDALVNLGFERNDENIKGKVHQRMDGNNPYL